MENETAPIDSVGLRLLKAQQEIKGVKKRGRNAHFNYSYVTDADILDASRNVLHKNGLLLTPSGEELVSEGRSATVKYKYTLTCPELGDEALVFTWYGEAQDQSDKRISKAGVSANKYFLKALLQIPSKDEGDPDNGPAPARAETDERAITAEAAAKAEEAAIGGWITATFTQPEYKQLDKDLKTKGRNTKEFLASAFKQGLDRELTLKLVSDIK